MTKRRSHGEGSIYKRVYESKDGRQEILWCASITISYDANGKRKRRKLYAKRKKDLLIKLEKLRGQIATGTVTEPNKILVGMFLDQWVNNVSRPSIRPSTYRRYFDLIRMHIKPFLGGTRLIKLQPIQIQAMLTHLENKEVGARTRELAYVVLRSALRYALETNLLLRNPCDAVRKPRVPKKTPEVFTKEQVQQLFKTAKDNRFEALYVLAVYTGLRQGELFALRWKDIDLKKGFLVVTRNLVEISGSLSFAEPKTNKSRRTVRIAPQAVEALLEHRKKMLAQGTPGPLVFCNIKGGPLRKSHVVRNSYKPLLRKAELPILPFHNLRHTAATMMLQANVNPKVVSEMLGHASVAFTLTTYSHVLPNMQEEAVDKLNVLLGTID